MNDRRSLSEPFRTWLADELNLWQQSSIISSDQVQQILNLYESPQQGRQRRQTWLAHSLVALAMILFAAAVLLLVSYNWQEIPAAGKLALIFGAIAATYGLGFYLRYLRGQRRLSEAIFLLGCLLYGAGIWLVAQIFHMSAHYPDGMFWWAMGVLPLAFLLDSLALHALLVALLATWSGLEIFGFQHLGMILWGWRWPVLPNGCYLALIVALAGLVVAYRRQSPTRVALYAPLIVWWTLLQPVAWRWLDQYPFYFVAGIGALLLVVSESHRAGSPLAIPYRWCGALLFGGSIYLLTFWDFHRYGLFHGDALWVFVSTAAILGLAATIFIAAEWLRYRYLERGEADLADRLDDVRRRQWLPLALVALTVALSLSQVTISDRADEGLGVLLPVLAANAAMIVLAVWLMWIGLRDDRGLPFAGGVLFFLLWIVSRYIDLFGQLGGMLGAALVFFLCGCTLLGVVWFWRHRKQVVHV